MKKTINLIAIIALTLILLGTIGCKSNIVESPESNMPSSPESNILSYDQYIKLITQFQNKMEFKGVPMLLADSTIDDPTVIIVDEKISFGKKNFLSAENKAEKSTQNFLIYEDEKNNLKLITSWIYTENDLGNNLLYLKPNMIGNTNDYNYLVSYKNILLYLQFLPISGEIKDFGTEPYFTLSEIESYLTANEGS